MRRCSFLLVLVVLACAPVPGRADVPDATVEGPIGESGIHGHPLWDSWYSLAELGYQEAEYFVSGTATSSSDPSQSAPYTTRIIVTRPLDPERFNGTVLLEWVNVTAQFENAVDIVSAHEMLQREGYAWVHVSAQAAGVCCTPLTPRVWDPIRYAELNHPGDTFSFDMFSQVAKAVRAPTGTDPMAGLEVQRVIAAGQSQSAGRLFTYVTQVQPEAQVIDAFLIHGGGDKAFDAAPGVPVLHLLSDREATPDEPNQEHNYRLWEIAGSAHSDFWIGYHQEVGQSRRFVGAPQQPASADEEMHAVAGNYGEQIHPMELACIAAGSLFPMRYSVSAAIVALDGWLRTGEAPSSGPRYEFDGAGRLARDGFGNALGGIRLPPIEIPIATYVSTSCELGGITIPFTEPQIQALYPTQADYVCTLAAIADARVAEGYLLPEDAQDLLDRAFDAWNRWGPSHPIGISCEA